MYFLYFRWKIPNFFDKLYQAPSSAVLPSQGVRFPVCLDCLETCNSAQVCNYEI